MDPQLIFNFLLPVVTLLVGYLIGSYYRSPDSSEPTRTPTNFDELLTQYEIEHQPTLKPMTKEGQPQPDQPYPTTPDVGIVRRPDATELERRQDPKRFEGEDEFRKTLESIPELNDKQELIEAYQNPISATNDPILSEEELELPEIERES